MINFELDQGIDAVQGHAAVVAHDAAAAVGRAGR